MSTHMYLTCQTHEPHIDSSEVGHNTSYLETIREDIAKREKLVEMVRESDFFIDLGDHNRNSAAYFFAYHPNCKIGIRDEYHREYTTEVGGHGEAIDQPCDKYCPLWVEPAVEVAPVRRARVNGAPHGTVSWDEFLEAYQTYHEHHSGQTAETIESRGGFGLVELTTQLGRTPASWEPDDRTSRRYFPREMR